MLPSGNTPAGVVPSPERRSCSGRVPLRPKRAPIAAVWHRQVPSLRRTATNTDPVVASNDAVDITTNWRTSGCRAESDVTVVRSHDAPSRQATSRVAAPLALAPPSSTVHTPIAGAAGPTATAIASAATVIARNRRIASVSQHRPE